MNINEIDVKKWVSHRAERNKIIRVKGLQTLSSKFHK